MRLIDRITERYRAGFWEGMASGAAVYGGSFGTGGRREGPVANLDSEALRVYQSNGVVWTVVLARLMLFTEAQFCFQDTHKKVYRNKSLDLLTRPWPNGTTGDLLARMEQDVSLWGNFFGWNTGQGRLVRMRPTEITIVSELIDETYREVIGYDWDPAPSFDGSRSTEAQFFTVDEVVHYCADEETEVLTADGWKDYRSVRVGDEVLTLNHGTGLSEWQPVDDLFVFPAQRRTMVSMEGAQHSSLTTENHRWPVERRNSRAGGYVRRWATSGTLSSGDRIPIAAQSADLPVEPKWSDALVELVAWYWTEGCRITDHGSLTRRISISQSQTVNAPNVERIRAALRTVFGEPRADRRLSHTVPRWTEYPSGNNAIFVLSSAASDMITAHAPGQEKVVTTEFLRSLTQAQIEMFIRVSLMADGHKDRLAQKDKARADQFALACILAGNAVSIRDGAPIKDYDYRMSVVRVRKDRCVYPQEDSRGSTFKVRRVDYDGHVWCPKTANTTWLARRRGSVYFTGNSPYPDPSANFRGMSWLTPVIREINGDDKMTNYKIQYLENAAVPNLLLKYNTRLRPDTIESIVNRMQSKYAGDNAYRTLVLDQGADATVVGSNLDQMGFTDIQAASAERIAAAGGVPMSVCGLGGAGRGNSYVTDIRRFGDFTMRPLWRNACGSLESLTAPDSPDDRLWFDVNDVAALRSSETERAQTIQVRSAALLTLTQSGFEREASVAAVVADDLTLLKPDPKAPPPGGAPAVGGPAAAGAAGGAAGVGGSGSTPQVGPRQSRPQTPASKAPAPNTFSGAHIPSANANGSK